MEMHTNDFDTYFEGLVNYYAVLGHSSTHNLSISQRDELIDAYHERREYFNMPKKHGTKFTIENAINEYLSEEFDNQFKTEIDDVPFGTISEEEVDNLHRAQDMAQEFQTIWE